MWASTTWGSFMRRLASCVATSAQRREVIEIQGWCTACIRFSVRNSQHTSIQKYLQLAQLSICKRSTTVVGA